MSSPLNPLAEWVVAEAEEAVTKTASGLYLPDKAAEKPKIAKVLKIGSKVKEIKAGKTREEIIKATAIPGVTEWKGDGIERGLQATYDELIQGII